MLFHVNPSATSLLFLRPCAVYGANDTHNSYGPNRFIRSGLKDGKITLFGFGEEKRDHVYVEDLSRLVELCLLHRSEGTLNLVSGTAVSFYDVAERIIRLSGLPIRIENLPRSSQITHR